MARGRRVKATPAADRIDDSQPPREVGNGDDRRVQLALARPDAA